MTFKEIQKGQMFNHSKFGLMRKIANNRPKPDHYDCPAVIIVKAVAKKVSDHYNNYFIPDNEIVELAH